MSPAKDELETLRVMVATAQDHLFIVDADGRILDVSPGSASVYGMSREALCATTVQALQASGVLSPSVSLEVIRSGQPAQLMQRTGTGRQVIAEAYPVYVDGRLARVISRSRDMTDLRLLQDEYALLQRRFAAHLERHGEPIDAQPADVGELVIKSRVMREITQLLQRSAPTGATVVMLGESGVGKTAFARQLHRWSRRSEGPFVDVNCAAIPESLFESEMFGYQPGAFSGAAREGKPGLLEQADGGTLFLDEIGELPLAMQSKLLKVIQDGSLMRLGDTRERRVDFRLVVATNRDLRRQVEEGAFRLDLYYRLNVIPVTLPPLRERREDVRGLAERHLARLNRRYGEEKMLDTGAWATLMAGEWTGNVRELENWLERAWLAAEGLLIGRQVEASGAIGAAATATERVTPVDPLAPGEGLPAALLACERRILESMIGTHRTTYALAARLGISQPSVVRKLKRHGLSLGGHSTPPGRVSE